MCVFISTYSEVTICTIKLVCEARNFVTRCKQTRPHGHIGIYEFNVKKHYATKPRQNRGGYIRNSTIILRWVRQIRICSNSQFSTFQTGCILDTEAQNCLTILEENWSHERNLYGLKNVDKRTSQTNLENKHTPVRTHIRQLCMQVVDITTNSRDQTNVGRINVHEAVKDNLWVKIRRQLLYTITETIHTLISCC